jgi:hypothetical protein
VTHEDPPAAVAVVVLPSELTAIDLPSALEVVMLPSGASIAAACVAPTSFASQPAEAAVRLRFSPYATSHAG